MFSFSAAAELRRCTWNKLKVWTYTSTLTRVFCCKKETLKQTFSPDFGGCLYCWFVCQSRVEKELNNWFSTWNPASWCGRKVKRYVDKTDFRTGWMYFEHVLEKSKGQAIFEFPKCIQGDVCCVVTCAWCQTTNIAWMDIWRTSGVQFLYVKIENPKVPPIYPQFLVWFRPEAIVLKFQTLHPPPKYTCWIVPFWSSVLCSCEAAEKIETIVIDGAVQL